MKLAVLVKIIPKDASVEVSEEDKSRLIAQMLNTASKSMRKEENRVINSVDTTWGFNEEEYVALADENGYVVVELDMSEPKNPKATRLNKKD